MQWSLPKNLCVYEELKELEEISFAAVISKEQKSLRESFVSEAMQRQYSLMFKSSLEVRAWEDLIDNVISRIERAYRLDIPHLLGINLQSYSTPDVWSMVIDRGEVIEKPEVLNKLDKLILSLADFLHKIAKVEKVEDFRPGDLKKISDHVIIEYTQDGKIRLYIIYD